jgi:hypothetical protein
MIVSDNVWCKIAHDISLRLADILSKRDIEHSAQYDVINNVRTLVHNNVIDNVKDHVSTYASCYTKPTRSQLEAAYKVLGQI